MAFSDAERGYLRTQRLGRITTIGPNGEPQLRPVGFRLNDDDTIDVGGPDHASSRRYRNLRARPVLAFLVDDMTPDEPGAIKPGMGRGVEIRGTAELTRVDEPPVAPQWFSNDIIRIHPTRILSWHIDPANPDGVARTIR
ncbi:MAG: pyridoxamine 5-phosphate oxidase family protein [Pseudonocardiales bacterium]|jgi:pyridoxamine 5'-phosphate oxidase family protein|nr:pyridoxamine 5-phosphate oxidase family protein [Pseudonocardiales bacterium]